MACAEACANTPHHKNPVATLRTNDPGTLLPYSTP
jgi:hypothetical protein